MDIAPVLSEGYVLAAPLDGLFTGSCAVLRDGRVRRRIEMQTRSHIIPHGRTGVLLRQAGFVVEAVYTGYGGRPATVHATGALLLARMPPVRRA